MDRLPFLKSLFKDNNLNSSSKKELEIINKAYLDLFETYGRFESTLPLQLSYGQFLAFNFNQPAEASDFLKNAYKLDISPYQEAMVKLKLHIHN